MLSLILIFLILISLCWGSFLNVVAYRIVEDKPFFTKRSKCPNCDHIIYWYDNIPVLSWIILKAKCRFCHKYISVLYPFIEVLTSFLMITLFFNIFYIDQIFIFSYLNILSFISYFVFFNALIISTRTDLQALVIPQLFSIYLVPVALIFSYLGALKISFIESLVGAIAGYSILWLTALIFKKLAKKEGLGMGDVEFLSMIGAFIGPFGVWATLFLASIIGLIIGIFYLLISKKDKSCPIPFGPFLALGAIIYYFFRSFFEF